MVKIFQGYCVGGPYDGKQFADTKRTSEVAFCEPMVASLEAPVELKYGDYKFMESVSEWHWHG